MTPFFLSLFVCLSLSSSLPFSSSTSSSSSALVTKPSTTYGHLNPIHTDHLPNYDETMTGSGSGSGSDKNQFHYILNNLIIQDDEHLVAFKILFTNNPSLPNAPHLIHLHHVRPTSLDDTTSDTRDITYINTITLDNIQSNVVYPIAKEKQFVFQKGDLLSVSVPNNAIFLNVGANSQGLAIPYGVLSVAPATPSVNLVGQFHLGVSTWATEHIPQLCAEFITVYGTIVGENIASWISPDYFFPIETRIVKDGAVVQFQVQHSSPTPVPFRLVFAKFNALTSEWFADPDRSRYFDAVASETPIVVEPPILVNKDDLVGWDGTLAVVQLSFPSIPRITTMYEVPYNELGLAATTEDTTLETLFQVSVNARITGDPQFAGFQGQSFQFHGLADEHFNLISSPQLQLNSHFVYLSSGKCDYNNTLCFQHPGTYLDILGFTIPAHHADNATADVQIRVMAGSHREGLRVWMGQSGTDNDVELVAGQRQISWTMDQTGQKATVVYDTFGQVTIRTAMFEIEVVNADFFFNLGLSLLDMDLLRIGRTPHTITDHIICEHDKHGHAHVQEVDNQEQDVHATHDHGIVEAELAKKYKVQNTVHGLIGQTWRNVRVCNKDVVGGVSDYLVSSLFGTDYYYQFYQH